MQWNGAKVQAAISAEVQRRLRAAAILVAKRAKELLSTAGAMDAGDVEDQAAADPAFAKQFNKNYAFRIKKGTPQYVRLKQGKVRDVAFPFRKKGKGKRPAGNGS